MNVLLLTNMYPTAEAPWYGVFVREQAESLRALGVGVEVCFIDGRADKLNYLRAIGRVGGLLRDGRFDLIHSHHTFATLVGLAARRRAGARLPLVQSFHEGEVFDPRSKVSIGRAPRHWLALKRFALRRVDLALPVERHMLAAVLGEVAGSVRAEVVPAGVDLTRFSPSDRTAARVRLGWPAEGTLLFFPWPPGKPAKRHDLAEAALKLVKRSRPAARLLMGGAIDYAQMPDALRAADVLLVLSDYEASPTVVKEALACERPVVATDVGDLRERYGDLPGVRITEPKPDAIAEAIEQVLAAPVEYGGRRRIRDLGLSLEATAARILSCYRSLL